MYVCTKAQTEQVPTDREMDVAIKKLKIKLQKWTSYKLI
jgi:hypothetical protein